MGRRLAVIFNPVSGKGKAFRLLPAVRERLGALSPDYEVLTTERPGHAEELAGKAWEAGFSAVVAAGGDGTCNEVINGLMRVRQKKEEPPVLGVLPLGRGNDFACGADVPSDIAAACAVLAGGMPRPLDVGRITGGFFPRGRYFGNGIGIGFDTIVGLEAAKIRFFHGALSYLYGALKTLLLYPKARDIDMTLSGKSRRIASQQISLLNGRRMGGMFYMAPDAMIDDGLLDLCMVIRPMTRRDMIGLILHYIKGTQKESSLIGTDRAEHVLIRSPSGGLVCHADGETICTDGTVLEVECLPEALRILNDPSLPHPLKSRRTG